MKNYKVSILLFAIATVLLTGCKCNCDKETITSNDSETTMNTTIETLMTRTSIRSFTDRVVSADTIEMLLRAGMAAPTAVNKQPWHFVVINDRAKLDELGGNGRQSQMWQESTLAIAVCGNMEKALEGPAQAFWI